MTDSDISFISTGRASIDRMLPPLCNNSEAGMSNPRLSSSSEPDGNYSFESIYQGKMSSDFSIPPEFTSLSFDSERLSSSSSQAVVRKHSIAHLVYMFQFTFESDKSESENLKSFFLC